MSTERDPLARQHGRGEQSLREMSYYEPRARRRTLYEDVTCDTQPSVNRHMNRGWPLHFEDGRSLWWEDASALRAGDWYAFRDPGGIWERAYYQDGSAAERGIDATLRAARVEGSLDDLDDAWVEFLRASLQVPAFADHGLWRATATHHRSCPSDTVAHCVGMLSAAKQRSAQALVLYGMDLDEHFGGFAIERSKEAWLTDPAWQPARDYVERLRTTADWGEVVVAVNVVFEPLVGTLLRRELLSRTARASGDLVTPAVCKPAALEWDWARGWTARLLGELLADERFGGANADVVGGWVADWAPRARAAAGALEPVLGAPPAAVSPAASLAAVEHDFEALVEALGVAAPVAA
jgi:propane 2-monooxygenase small subunit